MVVTGLSEDRPNLLLGVIVQTRGIKPTSPSTRAIPLSLAPPTTSHSVVSSLKRHHSASSDDHTSETTPTKRKRRENVVGFRGQTPPPVDSQGDAEPMEVGEQKSSSGNQKPAQMSFYGQHQSLSETNTNPPQDSGVSAPSTRGIKSILSQLSDEKLKELALAMSSLEDSSAPPPVTSSTTSEVASSTVTSPATGQTVTASSVPTQVSVSSVAHSDQQLAVAGTAGGPVKSDVPSQSSSSSVGGLDRRYPHHHPPHASQLQRPPLHDPNSQRPSPGQPPPSTQGPYHNYASPQTNEQGHPPANWNSPGPGHNVGPGPQIADHQYTGSPQQFSGPPNQFSGPPHHYSGPPTQPAGPPNQPIHGPQYPPEHAGGPHQHGPPYSYNPPPPQHYQNQYHQQQQHASLSDPRGHSWSHEGPPPHPPHSRQSHYYESESRLDDLESRDYGHRSQPPSRVWRTRDGVHHSEGRGRQGGWKGRQDYHKRDRR